MKLYAQVNDDEIVALFSSPQLEDSYPGVQEIESDDPRVVEFIDAHKIRGLGIE